MMTRLHDLAGALASRRPALTGHFRGLLVGLLVRLVLLLAGSLLVLLPEQRHSLIIVFTLIGVGIALVAPASMGSALALAGGIGCWLSGGLQAAPDLPRAIAFGYAIYVLHSCTALTAAAPLSSQLSSGVVRNWLFRSLLASAIAAVFIALTATVGRLESSVALQAAGLVGVLAMIAIPLWFLSRPTSQD
jgi:hypothetical protein